MCAGIPEGLGSQDPARDGRAMAVMLDGLLLDRLAPPVPSQGEGTAGGGLGPLGGPPARRPGHGGDARRPPAGPARPSGPEPGGGHGRGALAPIGAPAPLSTE